MKILKMALDLVWKRKVSFLLLLAQMIISTVILISLIGKVQFVLETKDSINIFNNENAFYFTPYSYYDANNLDVSAILKDAIHAETQVGSIANMRVKISDNDYRIVLGYNDVVISRARLFIKSGKWFDAHETYNGLPIISIGDRYEVGAKITIQGESGDIIPAEIIGTMDESAYIMSFNAHGSKDYSRLDNLIAPANVDFIAAYNSEVFPSLDAGDAANFTKLVGNILVVDDESIHDEIYEALRDYGEVSNITVMQENYSNELRYYYISNGVILLVFTLLALAGIGGINSMLSIENERRFVIYYMHGLTKAKCAIIELVRSSMLILISYFIVFGLYYLGPIRGLFGADGYSINIISFLLVLVYMVLIYVITSLPFVIRLGRRDLIAIYKQKA